MSVRGRIKDSWRERRLFEQRTIVVVILIGLLSSLLLGRLLWLQVLRYDHYTQLSQGNRVRVEPLPAARGIIYDRRGEVLADNQPTYQLELIPEEVPDVETTLAGLVRIGLIEATAIEDLKKLIRSRRSFESIPVRLRLDDQEIALFAVNRFRFPNAPRPKLSAWGDWGPCARLCRSDFRSRSQKYRSRGLCRNQHHR